MQLSELADYLETEFSYPVELSTVLEEAGAVQIEGADTDKVETIESVLGSLGEDSFESADELYESIYGSVSDGFIGRKYYDDRGGNPPEIRGAPSDEEHVSF